MLTPTTRLNARLDHLIEFAAISLGKKNSVGYGGTLATPVNPVPWEDRISYPTLYISDRGAETLNAIPNSGTATIKFKVTSRTTRDENGVKSGSMNMDILSIDPAKAKGVKALAARLLLTEFARGDRILKGYKQAADGFWDKNVGGKLQGYWSREAAAAIRRKPIEYRKAAMMTARDIGEGGSLHTRKEIRGATKRSIQEIRDTAALHARENRRSRGLASRLLLTELAAGSTLRRLRGRVVKIASNPEREEIAAKIAGHRRVFQGAPLSDRPLPISAKTRKASGPWWGFSHEFARSRDGEGQFSPQQPMGPDPVSMRSAYSPEYNPPRQGMSGLGKAALIAGGAFIGHKIGRAGGLVTGEAAGRKEGAAVARKARSTAMAHTERAPKRKGAVAAMAPGRKGWSHRRVVTHDPKKDWGE